MAIRSTVFDYDSNARRKGRSPQHSARGATLCSAGRNVSAYSTQSTHVTHNFDTWIKRSSKAFVEDTISKLCGVHMLCAVCLKVLHAFREVVITASIVLRHLNMSYRSCLIRSLPTFYSLLMVCKERCGSLQIMHKATSLALKSSVP